MACSGRAGGRGEVLAGKMRHLTLLPGPAVDLSEAALLIRQLSLQAGPTEHCSFNSVVKDDVARATSIAARPPSLVTPCRPCTLRPIEL